MRVSIKKEGRNIGVLGIVPPAGEGNDTGYGRYEVKRNYQFKVQFEPMATGSELGALLDENVKRSLTLAAVKCSRPKVTVGEMTIYNGNEQFNLAGKVKWNEELSVTFDDILPVGADTNPGGDAAAGLVSAGAVIYDWLNIIQSVNSGQGFLARDYKGNVIVTQYSPTSEVLERWLYYGAFPISFENEEWDMSSESSEFNNVTVPFKFDKVFRIGKTATDYSGSLESAIDADQGTESFFTS